MAGKVESVADGFVEGAFFDAGDVLLEVEQADYQFAIARAESQLAAAQQRLAEERGRNRQAEREWRELGSVEANDLFLRKPQMRAAQAALAAARADLAEAELALARTQIRAPFAGRIEVKRVDLGQYLTPGTPVAEIYATEVVAIPLPLNDSQLGALGLPLYANAELGRTAILSAQFGGQEQQRQAEIRRVEAVVDRQSRVNAIAGAQPFQPDNSTATPDAGMFVQAEIPAAGSRPCAPAGYGPTFRRHGIGGRLWRPLGTAAGRSEASQCSLGVGSRPATGRPGGTGAVWASGSGPVGSGRHVICRHG